MVERGIIMINNISEQALRVATRIDPSGDIRDKEVLQQKAAQIQQARPVEKSDGGIPAEAKKQQKEEKDVFTYAEGGRQLVYEKYNKNGDLILRIPPSSTPVDERI